MVHLEHGSATYEVLDVLEGYGIKADRVILAHVTVISTRGCIQSLLPRAPTSATTGWPGT